MASHPGKLIVIAGIDGSGKSEQTRRLVERLRAEGFAAREEEFPQYDRSFFGRAVGRYLRGEFGPAARLDPHLASVLYAGDRWEARPRMTAALDAGDILVCNRYVCANLAHQGGKLESDAAREEFFRWVEELEHEVFQIPRPDLTVLLWLPVETASALVERKAARAYLAGGKKDGHEADTEHLRRAQAVYEHLSRTRPNWTRVECVDSAGALLSREEIAARVWRCVEPLLNRRAARPS